MSPLNHQTSGARFSHVPIPPLGAARKGEAPQLLGPSIPPPLMWRIVLLPGERHLASPVQICLACQLIGAFGTWRSGTSDTRRTVWLAGWLAGWGTDRHFRLRVDTRYACCCFIRMRRGEKRGSGELHDRRCGSERGRQRKMVLPDEM